MTTSFKRTAEERLKRNIRQMPWKQRQNLGARTRRLGASDDAAIIDEKDLVKSLTGAKRGQKAEY